ncbi:hypothetical protein TNCV_2566031 [Trichonephila clavipes]|nr:hypothetical protein TNCV_2566031 [Trichonephila clavipes]
MSLKKLVWIFDAPDDKRLDKRRSTVMTISNGRRRTDHGTATAGSDVVQSGRPIFDDFYQHFWPYIGNNTANVVFQMVEL